MNRPDRKQFLASSAALLVGLALMACSGGGDEATQATSTSGGPGPSAGLAAGQPGVQRGSQSAQNAQALFEQGQMLAAQGDPQAAMDEYRRAIGLDDGLAEAHHELGRLLVQNSYVASASSRDVGILEEGIAELKRAAELRPDDADYAYWTGRALTIGTKLEDAEAEGASEVSEPNVEGRIWLEKAVQLDPGHGLAHKRLGMLHAGESRTALAKASFLAARESLPEDGGVCFQLGQLLEGEEDFEGARDAYLEAIAIDPILPGPYVKLAPVLGRLGDDEGARQAAADAERWRNFDAQLKKRTASANNDPQDVEALIRVGEMYFAVERWDEARSWFSRALIIDVANARGHLYLGIIARHRTEYEVAMNHLLEASYLAPDSIEPHLELVHLYAAMEDEAKLSEKLAELDGELAAEHLDERAMIASVLLAAGRKDAAEERYVAILEVSPEHEAAKAGLAEARGE